MLQPPPLQQVKQSPASRTRSRTNRVAKETGGATPPADDSLSAAVAPMTETGDPFEKDLDGFPRTVIVLEGQSTSMGALPEKDRHLGPQLLPASDEFAMDVDKSEEDDVREQLRMSSPLSEVPTDDPSRGSRTVAGDMDVEMSLSGEKTARILSRFFSDGNNSSVVELGSQGQQGFEKSASEPQEQMDQEEDPGEQTLGEQADDGSCSSSRFVCIVYAYR